MEELESSFGVSGALDEVAKKMPAVSFASWKRGYREKEESRAENDFVLSDVVEAVKGELLVKSFHNGFSGVSIDSRAIKKEKSLSLFPETVLTAITLWLRPSPTEPDV